MTTQIRVRGVSGLASCDACKTLISFEVSREALEHFEGIACPACKGTTEIHNGTVIPVIEVTAAAGGLE